MPKSNCKVVNNLEDYVLPEFGQMIHVSKRLKRVIYGTERSWVEDDYKGFGIYLGVRLLTDGRVYNTRGNMGERVSYKANEKMYAAMFSPGPNDNPIYVPLNSISI